MTSSGLRIVTRESPLALWQAQFVCARLQDMHPGLSVGIKTVKTLADRFLHKSLAQMGGKGVFVKELEQALMNNEADLAVHSMKDVTVDLARRPINYCDHAKRGPEGCIDSKPLLVPGRITGRR